MAARVGGRARAACGAVYALLGAAPLALIPPPPVYDATDSELSAYYITYGHAFMVITWLSVASIAFFLVFVAELARRLWRMGLATRAPAVVVAVAGVAWAAIYLFFSRLILAQPALAAHPQGGLALSGLAMMTDVGYGLSFIPAGTLLLAGALGGWRGALPRWLALAGLAVAGLQCTAGGSVIIHRGPLAPAGVVCNTAFALWAAWLLLAGVTLAVAQRRALV